MKVTFRRFLSLGLVCSFSFTLACYNTFDSGSGNGSLPNATMPSDAVAQTAPTTTGDVGTYEDTTAPWDTTTPEDTITPEDTTTHEDTTPPEDTGPEGPGNLVEVANQAGVFTTLIAAVDGAGLSGVVATQGPFTILAPTDDAFAKLPEGTVEDLLKEENKDLLTALLTYHVINGAVESDTVVTLTEAVSLSGETIAIEVVDGEVILNGSAKVTATDIEASNGVIHVIDTVLMPPSMTEPELDNIVSILAEAGSFSTLLAAVEAVGLTDTLANGGPFTLLAPTDDAFAALPDGMLNLLLNMEAMLTSILTYHLIEGTVGAEVVVTLEEAETVQGEKITIEVVDGAIVINGTANIIVTDIEVSNGVIHVIDAVILPPSLLDL